LVQNTQVNPNYLDSRAPPEGKGEGGFNLKVKGISKNKTGVGKKSMKDNSRSGKTRMSDPYLESRTEKKLSKVVEGKPSNGE